MQTNLWLGKIITIMMNHNLKIWLLFHYSYKIFQLRINNWSLQAGRRWYCVTRKYPLTNQKSPNLTFHQPTLQHTETQCVQKYNFGCCILFINMKGPLIFFKNQFWETCSYWLYSSLDSTFRWFVNFSIYFASIPNSTFFFKL
jgi:hypothetical protein